MRVVTKYDGWQGSVSTYSEQPGYVVVHGGIPVHETESEANEHYVRGARDQIFMKEPVRLARIVREM
jgi:hypothetical protein